MPGGPRVRPASGLLDHACAFGWGLEPRDLPDVRLDAALLQLPQRLHDEARAQLSVVALLAAGARELCGRGGDKELEQELPLARVQPVREPGQPSRLPLVQLAIPLGVVASQHLGEVGIEGLDVSPEVLAVLELELGLARSLHRHREQSAAELDLPCDRGAELLIDERAGELPRRTPGDGLLERLEDEVLGIADLGLDLG